MLASDLAKRLLVFTDQRTLAEANTAGVEYLESAIDAINQAAQFIYLKGPSSISVRDFGLTTRPVSTFTLSGSQYATSATSSGTSAWMTGCSFKLSGDTAYNRILENATGTLAIQNPLRETESGSTASVWSDALAITADIIEILGGVTLDDTVTLRAATNEQNLWNESCVYGTSDYGRQFPTQIAARPPVPGQPRAYYIEGVNPNTNAAISPLYMRLAPYPIDAHTIRFRAKVRPPKVLVADLDAANNGASCTRQIAIPAAFDELFLLPIAKQFFTGSPFFNNSAQKEEIARAAKAAMNDLDETRGQASRPLVFKPQV